MYIPGKKQNQILSYLTMLIFILLILYNGSTLTSCISQSTPIGKATAIPRFGGAVV